MKSKLQKIVSLVFTLSYLMAPVSADSAPISLTLDSESTSSALGPMQRVPVWSGGRMLRIIDAGTTAPILSTYDERGALLTSVTFTIPGAHRMAVSAFCAGSDGTLAVSGWAENDEGVRTSFFATIPPSGPQRIVQTTPYAATTIALAPDGTVWTSGSEYIDGREVTTDFHVVRHFDTSGKLLGSAIPRSTLKRGFHAMGFMAAGSDRVGWYAGSYPRDEQPNGHFEVRPDGTVRGVPGLILAKGESVGAGLAVTEAGTFISTQTPNGTRLYVLDDATPQWRPVELPASTGNRGYLIGGEAERLVWAGPNFTVQYFRISQ